MNKDLGPKVAAGLKWAGTVTDLPNTEAVLVGEIEKLINKAGGKRSVGNSQSVTLIDPAQYWWRDIDVPWVGYYITEHIRYLDKEKTIQGKTEKVREVEHAYLGVWRFGLSPTSEYALGPVRPSCVSSIRYTSPPGSNLGGLGNHPTCRCRIPLVSHVTSPLSLVRNEQPESWPRFTLPGPSDPS